MERIARIPEKVWGPVVGGFLIGLVGLLGWLAGVPWLFPSLGPTAYLQAERPELASSRFHNTLVGHLVGLGSGFLAVFAVRASDAPPVLTSKEIVLTRVAAAALAILLTLLINSLLRASHPPAAATTLLVALGTFRNGKDALVVAAGVAILAVLGEVARRLRLPGKPGGRSR